jgi:uncharacterized FlgJ-related protein
MKYCSSFGDKFCYFFRKSKKDKKDKDLAAQASSASTSSGSSLAKDADEYYGSKTKAEIAFLKKKEKHVSFAYSSLSHVLNMTY